MYSDESPYVIYDVDDSNTPLQLQEEVIEHTLVIHKIDENCYYSCLQCKCNYDCIDNFNMAHCIQTTEIEQATDENSLVSESHYEAIPEEAELYIIEDDQSMQYDCPNIKEEEVEEEEISIEHEENSIFCRDCYTYFNDLASASVHNCEKIESEDILTIDTNSYKCEKCPREFTNVKSLNSHVRVHNPVTGNSFKCGICNTSFTTQRSLQLHGKMHTERRKRTIEEALPSHAQRDYAQGHQFYCEICDKNFDEQLLLIHKNMHLSASTNKVTTHNCSICNKAFDSAENFKMHMNIHAELKQHQKTSQKADFKKEGGYNCQYCGHNFRRPHEKVNHERVHTGEKPYACLVCGKKFRVSYSLTLHLRTHTSLRPYVCEVCGKRYKTHPACMHHMRTHKNERNFNCDKCNKNFATAVQLYSHRNCHTKPFVCSVCNRRYSALYSLREHMQNHAAETAYDTNTKKSTKYSCPACGAIYERSGAFRKHMKESHDLNIILTKNASESYVAEANVEEMVEFEVENGDEAAVLIAAAQAAERNAQMNVNNISDETVLDNDWFEVV